jgi:hypothetical protein
VRLSVFFRGAPPPVFGRRFLFNRAAAFVLLLLRP